MEEPDLPHFLSIPWCSTVLSNPAYKITPTFARQPKPSTEDSLIALTLQSPESISHYISVYKIPPASELIDELRSLVTLGTGLNGGPKRLHGGIITTLIDDTMGMILVINGFGNSVTAKLDMKFLKPVETPGTVLLVAKCTRREGRRFWMEAWMEDAEGQILARGDAVWVNIGAPREKL